MDTILVELTNTKALQLLEDLEAMQIIRLHKTEPVPVTKLSDKYRGVLTKEEGNDLSKHIKEMRSEWNSL